MSNFDTGVFKSACFIHLEYIISRYLMSCSNRYISGYEKALRHQEIVDFYVSIFNNHHDTHTVRRYYIEDYNILHQASRTLTENLEDAIGYNVDECNDFEIMVVKFFNEFHKIALMILGDKTNIQ